MRRAGLPPVAAVIAAALLAAALATPAFAHHSGAAEDPRCAEWAAGNAPAGLDLTTICVAHEVVGNYTATGTGEQELLPWVAGALVTGMGLALVGVLALRFGRRPVDRRLAPEAPTAWWVCAGCRSLNASGRDVCYACRTPAPSDVGPLMPTADTPTIDQSFGRPSG